MTQPFSNIESADLRKAPLSERAAGVGALLRERRDELNWQLPDIAARLKIKAEFLDALERGDVGALPGPAYASGFLKAYADFLGLDGQEILRRFKQATEALSEQPALTFPMPLTERGIPGSGLVMVALILLGLGYGSWWYASSGSTVSAPAVEPVPARLLAPPSLEPPAINPESAAAAEPHPVIEPPPAATPAPSAPSPASAAPAATAPAGSQVAALPPGASAADTDTHVFGNPTSGPVVIKAIADTWVEVLDNNHSIWNRLLKPGDVYNPPKDGLVLRTGNAGGIQVIVNGKVLPPVGGTGEVRKIDLDAVKNGG